MMEVRGEEMGAIDRIGAPTGVSRDSASAGLETLDKRDAQDARNSQVDAAAKLYEKQFLREMVRAMRGTVSFGAMQPSMGESIYRGELDNTYVESWGDNGGVGLADLIYDQVMQRYFGTTDGKRVRGEKPQIPLSDRDILRVSRPKPQEGSEGQVPLKVEVAPSEDGRPTRLMAPWDSELLSKVRLDGGKTALTLGHGPSLRSTLIFDGVAGAGLEPGVKVEQGRTLGVLSPEIRSFFWNLKALDFGTDVSPAQAKGLRPQGTASE